MAQWALGGHETSIGAIHEIAAWKRDLQLVTRGQVRTKSRWERGEPTHGHGIARRLQGTEGRCCLMTTEELITVLAADKHVERKVDLYLLHSLLIGTCLVAVVFFAAIGFRDDIRSALGTARFLFKFAIVVPLALLAAGAVFRSATPLPVLGWWGRLLAIPPILLALGTLVELAAVPSSQWMTRLIGTNAVNCLTIIPTLGAGP